MLYIGCHLPSSKGYLSMGRHAVSLDANTFAFFTRNPRGGSAKKINSSDVESFLKLYEKHKFGTLVAHAPYTMNLCSSNPSIREFGRNMLADDMQRMEYTPGHYYNFHPGSHVGQGVQTGIEQISDALNDILTPTQTTTVLLEGMAGKGSEIGSTFEELKAILDRVELKEKMGICLDTCHLWEAGYNIVNNLEGVLEEFDRIVGIEYLKAMHLNDSKNPIGAHKDRHEKIGEGYIGTDALIKIINHPILKKLPFILETPNDDDGYANEISLMRNNYTEW
ncbi:MAG: deoxyribonuclease IV [Ruminococcus sp.]|nr:deoxyribonuclease IV [Ruminococcus sp.]